jgi:hypothetical protein
MDMTQIVADERIQPLWREMNAIMPVVFSESDSKCWGVTTRNGKAEISTFATDHPVESLAHELLHLKIQFSGYRRLAWIFWASYDNYSGALLTMLDNELQHHRMFPIFRAMGFDPRKFYSDDDLHTFKYLGKARHDGHDFRQPLRDYFSLIAPGGLLTDAQKAMRRDEFCRMGEGRFIPRYAEIDRIVGDWMNSPDFNVESTLRRLIHLFENPAIAWIGYRNGQEPDFPSGGFFIDDAFEVK